jgi:aryl-alcohol dehydrogenase-like predicted oxidoreductase
VESVDLVQLHSARREDIVDSTAWEVLDKARGQGKLRFIGATFYDAGAARAAVECGAYDTIQPTYNPAMFAAAPVIDLAGEKGVGVIVKTPLLKGAFSARRAHLAAGLEPTRQAVEAFAFLQRGDQSLPQACIRYCLAKPGVSTVIAGTQRIGHLEENCEAVDGELDPGELARIEELQRGMDFSGVEIP